MQTERNIEYVDSWATSMVSAAKSRWSSRRRLSQGTVSLFLHNRSNINFCLSVYDETGKQMTYNKSNNPDHVDSFGGLDLPV